MLFITVANKMAARRCERAWGANLGPSKFRAALESVIAFSAGSLGIVTIFWHDWIEALAGWDPDRHSGAAEWLIVAALLLAAAIAGIAARRDWRVLATARG